MRWFVRVAFIGMSVLLMGTYVIAAELTINAEKMICKKNENVCEGFENVKIVKTKNRGESKDKVDHKKPENAPKSGEEKVQTLTSNYLKVNFKKKPDGKKNNAPADTGAEPSPMGQSFQEIDTVHATGDVVVCEGDGAIQSQQADAQMTEKTETFTGDVRIRKGENFIKGASAFHDQPKESYKVKGDQHKKAQAIVVSKKKDDKSPRDNVSSSMVSLEKNENLQKKDETLGAKKKI